MGAGASDVPILGPSWTQVWIAASVGPGKRTKGGIAKVWAVEKLRRSCRQREGGLARAESLWVGGAGGEPSELGGRERRTG